MSYGSAATLWVFCLPWRGYSYSTQSSMMDGVTPVSVSTLKPLLRVIGVLPMKP